MASSIDIEPFPRPRLRHVLLAAAALSTHACIMPKTAHASTPSIEPSASNGPTISFHIPQKPLRDALVDFGVQAKTRLIFSADGIPNVASQPLNGAYPVPAGLSHLLSGSGLTYSSRDGSIFIQRASANITLGPVRVGGTVAHQDPTGPGVGYVATNTMSGTKTDTSITEIPNSIYVVTKQLMQDQ